MEKFEKRVFVEDLMHAFNLKLVSGSEESLKRWIVVPDVNRPGLELCEDYIDIDLKRVNILGNKEIRYLSRFEYEELRNKFEKITDAYSPCIIIAAGNKAPQALIDLAKDRDFPVFETELPTYRISVDITAYLDSLLANSISKHGVLLSIYGIGVLITGESGVGKSELALELIKKGHFLVADDLVEIKRIHNELQGEANKHLKNFLEIRGIGIIDARIMFGASSIVDDIKISLIINIEKYKENIEYDRIGSEDTLSSEEILGLNIPKLNLPIKEGRVLSVLVEAAVMDFRLKNQGYNGAKIFLEGIDKAMLQNTTKEE